jgi:hypothetical protein
VPPKRAFLGLTEIAGYYGGLAEGLRAHGIDAVVCDLSGNPYGFAEGAKPAFVRMAESLARRNARASRSSPLKPLWKALAAGARVPLFAWAAVRFDLFVFGFGTSFFAQRELRLLRLLGKRLVHVFHGSDSRPPYLDGSLMDGRSAEECVALTLDVKRRLRTIERSVDLVVSNPLSSQLHERPFVSFLALGVPRRCRPATEPRTGPRRALHSPSHPAAKGTREIREAVQRLNERGVALELVELTGRPNAEVLTAIEECDFVVDQLYGDVAMAGFASEAACASRPAVVGGYGREALAAAMCGEPFPPVEFCEPGAVEAAIKRLAVDEAHRRELGAEARAFVVERWAPAEVAGRLLAALDGDASLVVDPLTIDYVEGGGFERERLRALLREVVALGGAEALQVSDKPELQRRLLALAGAT